MTIENDTLSGGGEELSVDQAAAAYVQATEPQAVHTDQADEDEAQPGDTTDEELPATDDVAGEEDDGEAVEGEPQEDAGEELPESEQGRFVADNAKVRLDDGSVVSISDLKKGSLLHADYTRKTQEVAEQRRAVESQSERIKQTEKQIEEQRDYMAALLKSIVPPAPDPALLNSDPMGYLTQKTQHEQWVAQLNHIENEQQRSKQERQAQSSGELEERARTEFAALIGKLPELRDQAKLKAFGDDLTAAARAYGFSDDEIGRIPQDHRQALVLRDAMAYRKLQQSKPQVAKKVDPAPPVVKGGKRLSPDGAKAREASAAMNRLKASGTTADAVAAYLAQKG